MSTFTIPQLNWTTEVQSIRTASGAKYRGYTAQPTQAFWELYRIEKDALKLAGYSLAKVSEHNWLVVKSSNASRVIPSFSHSLQASRAALADASILAPAGLDYLPFQKAGIVYARSHPNVLFADEMGLGKTIEAIGVLNDDPSINTVIVVCPAYLKLNWRDEINKWYVRDSKVIIVDAKDTAEVYASKFYTTFIIINYDILSRFPQILEAQWDALIVDEAHYIKNRKTKRGAAVHKIHARRKLLLTGTPMLNRPAELYSLVTLLCPTAFPNEHRFLVRYCDGKDNGWGFEAKGCTNPQELNTKLRASCMVRRLKDEVLTELPAKRRQLINLPPTKEIRMVLDEESQKWAVHEEALSSLRERRAMAQITGNDDEFAQCGREIAHAIKIGFEAIAKFRVTLAWLKLPLVVHHCKELLEQADKIVVFWHHKEQCRKFAEEMGALCITGDTDMEDRNTAVNAFQTSPDVRVITGTIGAMGTGITLTKSSTVIFAEMDWRPGILMQAEDRCHRIGQHDSVLCQYLVFDNSVDSNMMLAVIDKMQNAKSVLDSKEHKELPEDITPQIQRPQRPDTVWAQKGRTLTNDEIVRIHGLLRDLASRDTDRARTVNGAGFNKLDSRIGHTLASSESLTPAQAAFARHLLHKYANTQFGSADRAFILAQ